MPQPTPPSSFKTVIVSPGGSICDKVVKLFSVFAQLVYNAYSYEWNENGTISDEMTADLCAVACISRLDPNVPAPIITGVVAGSKKLTVTWTAPIIPTGVNAVVTYHLYRAPDGNKSPNAFTEVFAGNVLTHQDSDPSGLSLVPGTAYRYWVRAESGTAAAGDAANFLGLISISSTGTPNA